MCPTILPQLSLGFCTECFGFRSIGMIKTNTQSFGKDVQMERFRGKQRGNKVLRRLHYRYSLADTVFTINGHQSEACYAILGVVCQRQ